MPEYIKCGGKVGDAELADAGAETTVRQMLAAIEQGGERQVLEYATKFDHYQPGHPIIIPKDVIESAGSKVPPSLRETLQYAHHRVKTFAEAQRRSIGEFEVDLGSGGRGGQSVIPLETAGCYCPGGRYAHLASALMSVTTAKVAGVKNIIFAAPPGNKDGGSPPPSVLYAAHLAGADVVLSLGGVQAIASLRFGLFTGHPANILVGPGNALVAEAKRQLSGPSCAIDVFAGPTEILVIADETADPMIVSADLVGQAEHGPTSPAWLITTSRKLAVDVFNRVPTLLENLPEPNRSACRTAWKDWGEIILAVDRNEAVLLANQYAPEHLEVLCAEIDLSWWKSQLFNYGSLFLGEGTCVTYGDKASGPNHILPTKGAGRHTGGLSVHKFLKVLTWQHQDTSQHETLAIASAQISRAEGMEGHAWAADARLVRYSRDEEDRDRLLDQSGAKRAGTAHVFGGRAKL